MWSSPVAERSETTGHGSPNVDGRSEIVVDENSQVSDDSDGTNKCASTRERTAGKLNLSLVT